MTGVMRPLGQNRMAKLGAVKIGVKTGRAMKAIETFRFLSNDPDSLDALAAAYGGTVKPFNDAKSPWKLELITTSSEIAVILPPNPLGDGPMYEKFGGKGIERRCDGTTCEIEQRGPDGPEKVDVPCMCPGKPKADQCRGTTRLDVIIPEARVGGTWQLVTKSEFAADELSTMVRMIQLAGAQGLTEARLRVDPRQTRGGANQFKVPMLLLNHTIQELMAGQGQLTGASARAALGVGTPVAIGPGSPAELPTAGGDSGVIDAEIVDDPITDEQLAKVKDLWGHLPTETAQKWVRSEQEAANLPAKATEMNREQAQAFISILNRAFD